METFSELREELKRTKDHDVRVKVREIKRRTGRVELFTDGTDKHTPGP